MVSQKEINALKQSLVGLTMVKDKKQDYVAVLVKVPKKGGSALLTLLKKGISYSLPALKSAVPSVASFLLLVGWELLDDVRRIATEIASRKETDESTSQIIKEALKKKYSSASVAIKKLIAYPIFEAILVGIAFKKLSEFDPTGVSTNLVRSLDAMSDKAIKDISLSIKTCPNCHAVRPQGEKGPEYFENKTSYINHVSSHSRGKAKRKE